MTRFRLAALCIGSLPFVEIASAESLKHRLLKATDRCRQQFVETESLRDAKQDIDGRNGYVRVYGTYPTCGCYCSSTAAAFKTAKGDYRFLSYHEGSCDWSSALEGPDRDVVLPTNLRAQFAPQLSRYKGPAVYFVNAKIPHHGTNLELSLELLPLGIRFDCPSGICMSRSESVGTPVGKPDLDSDLSQRFSHHRRVRFSKIVLSWNPKTGRFSVSKRIPAKKLTKSQFRKACGRWGRVC